MTEIAGRSSAASLMNFVVGPKDAPITLHFSLVFGQDYTNIQSDDPIPPLNVNGLRRLAKHLSALADLLEFSRPAYGAAEAKARAAAEILRRVQNAPDPPGTVRTEFR